MLDLNTNIAQLDKAWQSFFKAQLSKQYMQQLLMFLMRELEAGVEIYPPVESLLTAFEVTPFDDVKVVILGQDPYHQPQQAHGLSFSVNRKTKLPPSLKNIFRELENDLAIPISSHGDLNAWAKQGVLLLNSVLSVGREQPGSHSKQGWEQLSLAALKYLTVKKSNIVFLAWGRYAHKICDQIELDRHHLIKTSHPSPLGARKSGSDYSAFIGSHCFSECNRYLLQHDQQPINWSLNG